MRWNLSTPWHSTLLAHNNGEESMPKAKVGQAPPCPWLPPSRGKLQFMAVGTVTNPEEPSVEWIEGAFREPHVLTALLVQLRTRWWAAYHRGDSAATVAFRLHATTRWSQSFRIAVFNESFVGNAECLELEVDRHLLELAFPTTPGLASLPSAQQQLNRQSDQVSVFRQMVYSKFLLSRFFFVQRQQTLFDSGLYALGKGSQYIVPGRSPSPLRHVGSHTENPASTALPVGRRSSSESAEASADNSEPARGASLPAALLDLWGDSAATPVRKRPPPEITPSTAPPTSPVRTTQRVPPLAIPSFARHRSSPRQLQFHSPPGASQQVPQHKVRKGKKHKPSFSPDQAVIDLTSPEQ